MEIKRRSRGVIPRISLSQHSSHCRFQGPSSLNSRFAQVVRSDNMKLGRTCPVHLNLSQQKQSAFRFRKWCDPAKADGQALGSASADTPAATRVGKKVAVEYRSGSLDSKTCAGLATRPRGQCPGQSNQLVACEDADQR